MKLIGSSALTRLALNPQCGWQAVMVRSGLSEPKFFEELTGAPYPKEYGERNSARRRGAKFERNAYANDAALLKQALSAHIGLPPEEIWVRNLEDEEPGGRQSNRIRRWRRTRGILEDHVQGRPAAHILIQPQLHLSTEGLGDKKGIFVAPDVLYLSHSSGRYIPADLKSFVVRGNQVAPSDLERSRLQVAVQSLALHECLAAVGDKRAPIYDGGFIFATPYGLRPHAPQIESLDGSVDRIRKAISALHAHAQTIERAVAKDGAPREILVLDEVPNNYQERCIASCVLADVCRERHQRKAGSLGDAAADLLGKDFDLARAIQLKHGATPANDEEHRIAALLGSLDAAFTGLRKIA